MKKKKKHVAVYLLHDDAETLAFLAEKEYISVSQYIAKLLRCHIKENNNK